MTETRELTKLLKLVSTFYQKSNPFFLPNFITYKNKLRTYNEMIISSNRTTT